MFVIDMSVMHSSENSLYKDAIKILKAFIIIWLINNSSASNLNFIHVKKQLTDFNKPNEEKHVLKVGFSFKGVVKSRSSLDKVSLFV